MSNWKNGKCAVYEDRFGNTRCGACMEALFCDENGDMPDECPRCGAPLDYSLYDPVNHHLRVSESGLHHARRTGNKVTP